MNQMIRTAPSLLLFCALTAGCSSTSGPRVGAADMATPADMSMSKTPNGGQCVGDAECASGYCDLATTTCAMKPAMTDPCTDGSDCTQCKDFNSCYACNQTNLPAGEQLFKAFIECEVCTACYTVCQGAQQGCKTPPAMTDACDTGTPSMPGMGTSCGNSSGGCIKCAQMGPCLAAANACRASRDCIAFNQALGACPQN